MINKLLEAKDDDKPSKRRSILALKKTVVNNYSKYSGIVDDNGKPVDNPSVLESVKTMIKYLKKNTPESNVYRPEHAHRAVNYNKHRPVTVS